METSLERAYFICIPALTDFPMWTLNIETVVIESVLITRLSFPSLREKYRKSHNVNQENPP